MRDIVRLREVQDLASEGLNLAGIQRVLELQAEVEMLRNRLAQHEREKTSTALVVWRPKDVGDGSRAATWRLPAL